MHDKNNYWYLASYPKSGNTWCRLFINEIIKITEVDNQNPSQKLNASNINLKKNLSSFIVSNRTWVDDQIGIDSSELTQSEIDKIRPLVHNHFPSYTNILKFHKVHDALTKNNNKKNLSTKNCSGIVYLIRNPLDIIVSMESFFGWNKNKCINFMLDKDAKLADLSDRSTNQICQYIGRWDHHVKSWTNQNEVPLIICKYEDLLKYPTREFTKISYFLNLSRNKHHILKAINNCSFKNLRKLERKTKFVEASPKGNSFFRFGQEGKGEKQLSKKQKETILINFEKTLKNHNYS